MSGGRSGRVTARVKINAVLSTNYPFTRFLSGVTIPGSTTFLHAVNGKLVTKNDLSVYWIHPKVSIERFKNISGLDRLGLRVAFIRRVLRVVEQVGVN